MSYTTKDRLAEVIEELKKQGIKKPELQVLKFNQETNEGFEAIGEKFDFTEPYELKEGEWLSVLFYDGHREAQRHIDPDGQDYGYILSNLRKLKYRNNKVMKTYKDQFIIQLKKVDQECGFDDSDRKSIHTLGEEWSEEDESNKLARLESVWRGEVLSLLDEVGLGDTETVWSVIKRSVELGEIIEQRKTVFNRDNAKTGKPIKEGQYSRKPKRKWTARTRDLLIEDSKITSKEVAVILKKEGFVDFDEWGDDVVFYDEQAEDKPKEAFSRAVSRIRVDLRKKS
jgi:hypothetical protein